MQRLHVITRAGCVGFIVFRRWPAKSCASLGDLTRHAFAIAVFISRDRSAALLSVCSFPRDGSAVS